MIHTYNSREDIILIKKIKPLQENMTDMHVLCMKDNKIPFITWKMKITIR